MSAPEKLVAGRYRLVQQVGVGGMGVVWEGWDERLERRVAVKRLRLPPGLSDVEAELANQRAMREARITGRLHHRNAVAVFDVVDDEGTPSLIMQFLSSITLAAVLRDGGPLQLHEAAQVGAEVASALSAAHGLGIVHRDVKPSNILIADDGGALISDFGISQALGDVTLTATGLVHGTLAYLSPEVARGAAANFASDVFSLGATLYAALEGAPPFGSDQNPMALLHRVASGDFELPRQSGTITPLLLRMLSPEPSDRPSMRATAHSLAVLTSGTSALWATPPASSPPRGSADLTSTAPTPGAQNKTEAAAAPTSAEIQAPTAADASRVEAAAQPPRGRRAARTAVLVAALVVVGTLITLLGIPTLGGGPGSGSVAQPPDAATTRATPETPPASAPTTSANRQPTPSVSAAAPAPASSRPSAPVPSRTPQRSTQKTSASSQLPSATPGSTGPPGSDSVTTVQLAEAISSYYELMPENTAQGWPRMTDSYQINHTGGRRSYERFWGQIRRVTLEKVTARPPRQARATVTYYYKNGRVDTEPTVYQMVEDDGSLKINKSTVLSSSTR